MVTMTLLEDEVAERGNIACIQQSSGKIVAGAATTAGLVPIGVFAETKIATGGDKPIKIDLFRTVTVHWFANAGGGGAIAATDVGSNCYLAGPGTVTIDDTDASIMGMIWAVDAAKGVAVEMSLALPGPQGPQGEPGTPG